MITAIVKGLRQGLIIGIFSLVGWVIGLVAAIKLSAVVAVYLGDSLNIAAKWLPILSFILVFIAVMLLVRIGAGLLEKTIELTLMGWVNRIGGMLLYMLLYTFIFSIVLFYAGQLKLISEETSSGSLVYSRIRPIGPVVIDGFGKVIPVFKNMFTELEEFFEKISERATK